MSTSTAFATLAALAAFALPASAQCPASGAAGLPDAEPVSLVMKYAWKLSDVKPTALKNALEKLPIVVRTAFDEKSPHRILVKFKGKCDQVASLETAAREAGVPAYVVNHAHVSIVLKVQPGANVKAAIEAMSKVPGALYAKPSGSTGLELHADLQELQVADLQNAVAPFKCEAVVNQSFEYVKFKVLDGDLKKFEAALDAMKGVMVVQPAHDGIYGLWINKAAVKAEQIEKLEGFKLDRL